LKRSDSSALPTTSSKSTHRIPANARERVRRSGTGPHRRAWSTSWRWPKVGTTHCVSYSETFYRGRTQNRHSNCCHERARQFLHHLFQHLRRRRVRDL
jgi:hypothetical protein